MEELTCVGCALVIDGGTPEIVIDKMAAHFEQCDEAKALLHHENVIEAAEIVDEDMADVGGHLLCLSSPIFEPVEGGGVEAVGMSSIFFGTYATRAEAKADGDRYLLSVAGLNCGDNACLHEHAHDVSVLSFHTVASLDGFITNEQEHYQHMAEHRANGTVDCDDCRDEEAG